jgi:hypothetical protein
LSRDEWKEFFSGHWQMAGERQVLHEAMFPEELPYRLIRMFSFVGEIVLARFLAAGRRSKLLWGWDETLSVTKSNPPLCLSSDRN